MRIFGKHSFAWLASALLIAAVPHLSAQVIGAAERAAARAAGKAAERTAAERAAAKTITVKTSKTPADRVVKRWSNYICEQKSRCPLPQHVAQTFRGGSYNQVELQSNTVLYRVHADPALKLGRPGEQYSFWSRSDARGIQAAIDSAIPVSRNGNTAQLQTVIRVPRGTTVYEGITGQTAVGRTVGGGNQVVVKEVNPKWVLQE